MDTLKMSPSQSEDKAYICGEPMSMDELETCIPCRFPTLVGVEAKEPNGHLSLKTDIADYDTVVHFCAHHSIPVSNLLQAAWALVLGGYAGTTDICFGYRSLQSPANTTLFRVQLDLKWSLLETVRYVQSSKQCCVPLSPEQWLRLLQPGPNCISNSEVQLGFDQQVDSEDDAECQRGRQVCSQVVRKPCFYNMS